MQQVMFQIETPEDFIRLSHRLDLMYLALGRQKEIQPEDQQWYFTGQIEKARPWFDRLLGLIRWRMTNRLSPIATADLEFLEGIHEFCLDAENRMGQWGNK